MEALQYVSSDGNRRKANLDAWLNRMYDRLEDAEVQLIEIRARKQAVESAFGKLINVTGERVHGLEGI